MRDEAAPIFPREATANRFATEKMVEEKMVEEKMAEEPILIEDDKKTAEKMVDEASIEEDKLAQRVSWAGIPAFTSN